MKVIVQEKLIYPEIIWKRPVHFYKNRAGRLLILAGSANKSNEAVVVTEAVFRSGTGNVTLGFPEGLKRIYNGLIPEAIVLPLPETLGYTLGKKSEKTILDHSEAVDLVVIGPGLSQNAETQQLIWELIFETKKTIVLSSDALAAFTLGIKLLMKNSGVEGLEKYLSKRKHPTIIIFKTNEIISILKKIGFKTDKDKKLTSKYIESNKKKIVRYIADLLKVYIVLETFETIISGPNEDILINRNKKFNQEGSKSNEALPGIIGSFVAKNPKKIFEAISTAIYIHDLATEMAQKRHTKNRIMPSDVIKSLPQAIKEAEESI